MFQLRQDLKLGWGSRQKQKTKKISPIKKPEQSTTETEEIIEWIAKNKEKISKFTDKIKENYNGVVLPVVNYVDGKCMYLALKEIEEDVTNTKFLERLTNKKLDFLEKFAYNRFLVCPEHQSSFLVNVRLFCPNCNSTNVEKLHLLEHKSCGHLAEKSDFAEEVDKLKCPSCNKSIKIPQKELRIPATWYFCNECKEKFDDAKISFYCKEFDHSFNVDEAKTITIYGYAIKNSENRPQFDHLALKSKMTELLSNFGFSVEDNHIVKGRSGHDHIIDMYGVNDKNQTIFILINNSNQNISIDSTIIQILDTSPKIAILIGYSSITEKTKSIASKYNMSIILSQTISEILSETEKAISHRLNKPNVVLNK